MGIHGLMQILKDEAPNSYKELDKKEFTGKIIAIDASIALYQFMAQIRTKNTSGYGLQLLTDSNGEITSHIQGFFNRAANLLENGIKPIYVFDGKPPVLKYSELSRRRELKKKAEKETEEALERAKNAEDSDIEDEAVEDMNKASRRNIHITKQQIDDVKILLKLMGIPVIDAPCEAEAQCAELVKSGVAYATATEDMDSLTFNTPIVLRKLAMSEISKEKVIEINIAKVLEGLKLTYLQFIDMCILCGCDYIESIKGIGAKTALKLLRKYGNIESIIKLGKYEIPVNFEEKLNEVRKLFLCPEIVPSKNLLIHFNKVNNEEIMEFLLKKGFNKERINNVLNKIEKKITVNKSQPTILSFIKKQ